MRFSTLLCFFGCTAVLAGCVASSPTSSPSPPSPAPATSMSAGLFYAEFPVATQSKYLTGAEASAAVAESLCIRLDMRSFDAPVGTTVYEDLQYGAEGVDAIVANDGGNAYRIDDFEWRNLLYANATQLRIDFHTYLCDFTKLAITLD